MQPLSRRTFLEISGATAAGALTACGEEKSPDGAPQPSAPRWFESAWRRAVIDMHIPDWDEAFLSQFDPRQYVEALVKSRAQSIVCYCQSHVGLFNFPTQVGKQHAALGGRNVLQEVIECCHERGVAVVLYTSLIFDRWAGDNHPEWRMRTWDGKIQGEGGRHAVLCVNSPYRDYVRRFVEEICRTFDFEGIRFDMTFWPWLCYCDHCRRRFSEEVGGAIPTTVDWFDPRWVAFQRRRERWLVEFAELATGVVRSLQPQATVEHQSSTFPLNWMFGVTAPLAAQNDFLQGDFYGDRLQGSFVRKLLEDLSPKRPIAFETSFSVSLQDHTAMKSEELLEAKAAAAIADAAAFVFIDAIDPIGTVNHAVHERMGRVFDRLLPYYEHLGGERVADVGVFYSLESKFNPAANGRPVASPDTSDTHTQSVVHVVRRLAAEHVPFRILTKSRLRDEAKLADLKVLILSNVHQMDEEECQAVRAWVEQGGKLYASGGTSLVDKSGKRHDDFLLADVFGVSLVKADWSDRKHYLAPTAAGLMFFADFTAERPAFCNGVGFEVKPHAAAQVLATTTLPWPAPDASKFASIHSDPPWRKTENPEIVLHRFGKGEVVYCASLLEDLETLQPTFARLLRRLHNAYRLEADAPAGVEATLFHQPDRGRYLVSLVNFQDELPNLPVEGIEVRLRLPAPVQAVTQLPDGRVIHFRQNDGVAAFNAPRLHTLAMFEVRTA